LLMRQLCVCRVSGPRRLLAVPGQALAGRLVFWRRRRVGGVLVALVALVVDPGLRPRFFSVLPMCCSFRAR
jgi:hypothetical protein